MNELQILFRLNELDNNIPLSLALEIMGRVVFTAEALEDEDHEYDEDILIKDTLETVLSEM